MKKAFYIGLSIAIALVLYEAAHAASISYSATAYGRLTTSVSSATVPVNVMPATQSTVGGQIQAGRGTYQICNRTTSGGPVLCWDYTGTLPSAVPTNVEEIPVGQCHADGKDSEPVIGLAFACAQESATSAATVDSKWR